MYSVPIICIYKYDAGDFFAFTLLYPRHDVVHVETSIQIIYLLCYHKTPRHPNVDCCLDLTRYFWIQITFNCKSMGGRCNRSVDCEEWKYDQNYVMFWIAFHVRWGQLLYSYTVFGYVFVRNDLSTINW